jgi:hypothetical protein
VAIADIVLLSGVLPHLVVSSVLEEEKLLPKIIKKFEIFQTFSIKTSAELGFYLHRRFCPKM